MEARLLLDELATWGTKLLVFMLVSLSSGMTYPSCRGLGMVIGSNGTLVPEIGKEEARVKMRPSTNVMGSSLGW